MDTPLFPDTPPPDCFKQTFALPYSAVGPSGRLRPDRLVRLFQDAASEHSYILKCSGLQLAPSQVQWVVSRYQIYFKTIPSWPDPLTLKTWRLPWKNLYELRYLQVENSQGDSLIQGIAFWNLINSQSGKPVRLNKYLPRERMAGKPEMEPQFWPNDHKSLAPQFQHHFKVQARELDMNQHVNNTAYVTWALTPLPLAFLGKFLPVELTISYLKPSFYRNGMTSEVEIKETVQGAETRHIITNQDTGQAAVRMTLAWKRMN
ncbi:MAG: thioesterase [Desulfobacterales bacterium]|nr:thioesterase [Desulfobacterales bacterium]